METTVINALGLVLQNIEFAYNMDDLNDEFMDKSINKSRILVVLCQNN